MKLFNCSVRLGGNVLHDVPKYDISEMEIRVLQSIHGDDAVINIKTAGEVEREDLDEAGRLANDYGEPRVAAVTGIKNIVPLMVDVEDEQSPLVAPVVVKAPTKAELKAAAAVADPASGPGNAAKPAIE